MTTSANMEETVNDEVRDTVFKELKKINRNNICIDCEKKNPTWASIHLGVHLCIDCAGKHRQYGVMYSFVKSTNLDKWNRKQLMFMQKGGNQRAIEYLTRCGVIGENHKHIDYKSPIVQRYKGVLTEEVDTEILGKPSKTSSNTKQTKVEKVQQGKEGQIKIDAPSSIPNAETVQAQQKGKKKSKKKVGKKIDVKDFEDMVFDDGVPVQQKQKIVKAYESSAKVQQTSSQQKSSQPAQSQPKVEQPQKPIIQPPKQMNDEQAKQKLQQLKTKQNVKSISSEQFKDTALSTEELKSNLNRFQDSKSISSKDFYGGQQENGSQEGQIEKIKDIVTDVGGKLYGKLASYWNRGK